MTLNFHSKYFWTFFPRGLKNKIRFWSFKKTRDIRHSSQFVFIQGDCTYIAKVGGSSIDVLLSVVKTWRQQNMWSSPPCSPPLNYIRRSQLLWWLLTLFFFTLAPFRLKRNTLASWKGKRTESINVRDDTLWRRKRRNRKDSLSLGQIARVNEDRPSGKRKNVMYRLARLPNSSKAFSIINSLASIWKLFPSEDEGWENEIVNHRH